MEEKAIKELKEIKRIISRMVGTYELPANQRFSKKALDQAAKEFRDLSIKRKEWISRDELYTVIKDVGYSAGKFIIEQFGFSNYFMRGKTTYFNRKDLLALMRELKKRNINLKKYMELVEDKEKFEKYVQSINLLKGKKRKRYKIPEGLKDIVTEPYHPPSEKIVRDHLNSLWEQYHGSDMEEYIDIFPSQTWAMFKFEYHFDRYLDADLKRRCKKWCFEFNYANEAMKKIKKQNVK